MRSNGRVRRTRRAGRHDRGFYDSQKIIMSERTEKVSHEIMKLAATFIEREGDKTSLITVTRVSISPDLKQSTIYISVLPDSKQEAALNFCKRKMTDFKRYVME